MSSKTPPTEEELVDKLRSGDEAAFSELIDRHHGSMLRIARIFVDDEAAAEEVVQETWVAVIGGLDDFEERSSLKTWIFSILSNQAKSRARTDARTKSWSSLFDAGMDEELSAESERFDGSGRWKSPPIPWKFDPEERMMKHKLLEVVQQALDALPASQRGVVWLRDVEGLSSEEVCQVFDLTAGNQRVLLHRGRAKVREAVESYQEAQ
jgi:RNA polymerase sigma-70 factor (ECF subfamily)